ncbi:MAG: hypothetical protein AB7U29_04955, partial [Desulfobulbus sp.]
KGAYAHPNSIKLLLTFFYNFEKIISSPEITGDLITQLLKGDVRKFKILQYQITQSEQGEDLLLNESPPLPLDNEQPIVSLPDDISCTHLLKASILSLDWEVTDESLLQFNAQLAACHQQMTKNKPALVLLQGLQALGDYISDERANSHPDAFILLHSFNEALEQVSAEAPLDDNETQELLVDRINRLNNLKMILASPEQTVAVDEDMIAGVVEEISGPAPYSESKKLVEKDEESSSSSFFPEEESVTGQSSEEEAFSLEAEIDSFFGMESKPAMETADEQYPDEILPPDAIHPVADELADDLIGAQLSFNRGFAPALSDADETAGFNADDAYLELPGQNDLAEQLDFLFADTDKSEPVLENSEASNDSGSFIAVPADDPIAALSDVAFSFEETDEELQTSSEEQSMELEAGMLDIESKLDNFFNDAIEESTEPTCLGADVEKNEQSLFFDDATSPAAALVDSEEQGGFSEEDAVAYLGHSPLDEIEQKLDFFFGNELDAPTSPAPTEAEEPEDTVGPVPALSDFDEKIEEEPPVAALNEDEGGSELSGALDAFFDTATETADLQLDETAETDTLIEALEATLDERQDTSADTFNVDLATLGAILPAAVRVLDRAKLKDADAMLNTLQQESPSGEHKALAQLLQSVITMLSRLPAKSGPNTEKLINYLYEQLLLESLDPSVLVSAIGRFNRWMQQAGTLIPLVPAVSEGDENEQQFHYTAKELYFELAELRSYMNEEFSRLRHDMKHHN